MHHLRPRWRWHRSDPKVGPQYISYHAWAPLGELCCWGVVIGPIPPPHGAYFPSCCPELVKDGSVTGVRLETMPSGELHFCESCVYAKATWKPVAKVEMASVQLYLVVRYTVICGDLPQLPMKGGWRYYITFMDNKTCLTHLHLLHNRKWCLWGLQGLWGMVWHTFGCHYDGLALRSWGWVPGKGVHCIFEVVRNRTETYHSWYPPTQWHCRTL